MKQEVLGIVGTVIDTFQILIAEIVIIRSEAYLSGGAKISKPCGVENICGWAGLHIYMWMGGLATTLPPPHPTTRKKRYADA